MNLTKMYKYFLPIRKNINSLVNKNKAVLIYKNIFTQMKEIIISAAFGGGDNRVFYYIIKFMNKH